MARIHCRHAGLRLALSAGLAMLWPAAAAPGALAPLVGNGASPPEPWHVAGLPQQRKPFTNYDVVELDGQRVLRLRADHSYGNLVHGLAHDTPMRRLSWRWRLDQPLARANLHEREGDDTAVKICALFDMSIQDVPFVERQLLRLARARTGEPLPAASVCYVWDPRLPQDLALDNAFTHRLRMIVLRGAGSPLRTWVAEQRDLGADFLRLFGKESAQVPPLLGIAVSADADNTGGHSLAYVSDLILQ